MNETPVPPSPPEPPDHYTYRNLSMSKDGLSHYRRAAEHYKGLLERAQKKVEAHKELLAALLAEKDVDRHPMNAELVQVERVITWLAERIKECGEDDWGWLPFVDVSHGTIRYIKSVCRLYEEHLLELRDRLAADPEMPESSVSAVDLRLAELREKTEMGVFANASAFPLLVSRLPMAASPPAKLTEAQPEPPARIAPEIIHGLQFLDGELRSRCADLFQMFAEKNLEERYDTLIREIGVLVEDRLRRACRAPKARHGVELASFAFSGGSPRLVLSREAAEQDGVHHLFRGFFGWIRNPAGHRLLGKLSRERVLQLLGFADYLLGLVGEASVSSPARAAPGTSGSGRRKK